MELAQVVLSREEIKDHTERWKTRIKTPYDRVMDRLIAEMEAALERVDSGAQIVSLVETIRRGGCTNDNAFPALGLAPARLHGHRWEVRTMSNGECTFSRWWKKPDWLNWPNSGIRVPFSQRIDLPAGTLRREGFFWDGGSSEFQHAWTRIPVIPPQVRPLVGANTLILWEARWNRPVPKFDPALLEPLGNNLAEVKAQWDMTPLETEALRLL